VEQAELLQFTLTKLEQLGIDYMLVGSFASGIYGEPRFTQDIDVVAALEDSQVELILESFPSSEFYLSRPAISDAIRNSSQFNIIHPASGNKIDVMVVGKNTRRREELNRRRRVSVLPGFEGSVAAIEDVIICKLKYYQEGGSDKHLRDIAGMLKISGDQLDMDYISRLVSELGISDLWELVRVQQRPE